MSSGTSHREDCEGILFKTHEGGIQERSTAKPFSVSACLLGNHLKREESRRSRGSLEKGQQGAAAKEAGGDCAALRLGKQTSRARPRHAGTGK